MVERGKNFCFATETTKTVGVTRPGRRQNLQGNLAAELTIARAINLAHPANAQERCNLIGTNSGSGSEEHEWRDYNLRSRSHALLVSSPSMKFCRALNPSLWYGCRLTLWRCAAAILSYC